MPTTVTTPVAPDQHAALADFLADFDEGSESADQWRRRFEFWWVVNPAARDAARGWVLTSASQIVGFIGLIPGSFQFADGVRTVYSATTWRVAEEHRARSLGLLLKAISAAKDTVLFNTSPTWDVVPILQKLQFRLIPRGDASPGRRLASVLLVNPRSAIARKLGGGAAALAFGAVSGPLLGVAQRVRLGNRGGASIRTEVATHADESFDDLWARTKEGLVTSVRTADAVNWYCFSGESDKVLITARSGDRLVGYCVLWTGADPAWVLECADLWFDESAPGVLDALVRGCHGAAQSETADAVVFPHFTSDLGRRLKALGLVGADLGDRTDYLRGSLDVAIGGPAAPFVSGMVGDSTIFSGRAAS